MPQEKEKAKATAEQDETTTDSRAWTTERITGRTMDEIRKECQDVPSMKKKLIEAIWWNYYPKVRKYIERGVPVNFLDANGDTPLIHAARDGRSEIIKLLLQHGADATPKCINTRTALDVARENGDEESKLLILQALHGSVPTGLLRVLNNADWSPRAQFGVASVCERIYCIGGFTTQVLSSVQVYNPFMNRGKGKWLIASNMSVARKGLCAVAVGTKIFAIGGNDSRGQPLANVEVYDCVSDIWSNGPPLRLARSDLCASVYTWDGVPHIIVTGGHKGTNTGKIQNADDIVKVVEILAIPPGADISGLSWRFGPQMISRRSKHSQVCIDNNLYVIGGFCNRARRDCEVFDVETSTWTSLPPLRVERMDHACFAMGNRVHLMGGFRGTGSIIKDIEVLEGDRWIRAGTARKGRRGHAAISMYDEVLMIGGVSEPGNSLITEVEQWRPAQMPKPDLSHLDVVEPLLKRNQKRAQLEKERLERLESEKEDMENADPEKARELKEKEEQKERQEREEFLRHAYTTMQKAQAPNTKFDSEEVGFEMPAELVQSEEMKRKAKEEAKLVRLVNVGKKEMEENFKQERKKEEEKRLLNKKVNEAKKQLGGHFKPTGKVALSAKEDYQDDFEPE